MGDPLLLLLNVCFSPGSEGAKQCWEIWETRVHNHCSAYSSHGNGPCSWGNWEFSGASVYRHMRGIPHRTRIGPVQLPREITFGDYMLALDR